MRHFHDTLIGKHAFFSIQIEGGYTGVNPDIALQSNSVLGALCECLEIDYVDAVRQISTGSGVYESARLAPNEVRAVQEFYSFFQSVQSAWKGQAGSDRPDSFEGVWLYTNLNEGKSVAWSVFLEG